MLHALNFGSFWGIGVLTGATYDHRATHPPLVVRYVQDDRFNLPLWYPTVTVEQDD